MQINYSKQAVKFLSKQNKIVQKRIIDAINKLPSGDVRKLQGRTGYRLRVGQLETFALYSTLLEIFYTSKKSIIVDKFINRRDYYERNKRKDIWCCHCHE